MGIQCARGSCRTLVSARGMTRGLKGSGFKLKKLGLSRKFLRACTEAIPAHRAEVECLGRPKRQPPKRSRLSIKPARRRAGTQRTRTNPTRPRPQATSERPRRPKQARPSGRRPPPPPPPPPPKKWRSLNLSPRSRPRPRSPRLKRPRRSPRRPLCQPRRSPRRPRPRHWKRPARCRRRPTTPNRRAWPTRPLKPTHPRSRPWPSTRSRPWRAGAWSSNCSYRTPRAGSSSGRAGPWSP